MSTTIQNKEFDKLVDAINSAGNEERERRSNWPTANKGENLEDSQPGMTPAEMESVLVELSEAAIACRNNPMAADAEGMQFLKGVSEICGQIVNRKLEMENERLSRELSDLQSRDPPAAQTDELNIALEETKTELERWKHSHAALCGDLEVLKGEKGNLEASYVELREYAKTKKKTLTDLRSSHAAKIDDANKRFREYAAEHKRQVQKMTEERDFHKHQASKMEQDAQKQAKEQARILQESLDQLTAEKDLKKEEIQTLTATCEGQEAAMKANSLTHEALERQLKDQGTVLKSEQDNNQKLTLEITGLRSEMAEMREQLDAERQQVSKLRYADHQLRQDHQTAQDRASKKYTALDKRFTDESETLKSERDINKGLRSDIAGLQEELKAEKQKISTITLNHQQRDGKQQSTIASLTNSHKTLMMSFKNEEQTRKDGQIQIEGLESVIADMRQQRESQKQYIADLKDEMQKQLEDHRSALKSASEKYNALDDQFKVQEDTLKTEKNNISVLQRNSKELEAQIEGHKSAINSASEKYNALDEQFKVQEDTLKTEKSSNLVLQRDVKDLEGQLEGLKVSSESKKLEDGDRINTLTVARDEIDNAFKMYRDRTEKETADLLAERDRTLGEATETRNSLASAEALASNLSANRVSLKSESIDNFQLTNPFESLREHARRGGKDVKMVKCFQNGQSMDLAVARLPGGLFFLVGQGISVKTQFRLGGWGTFRAFYSGEWFVHVTWAQGGDGDVFRIIELLVRKEWEGWLDEATVLNRPDGWSTAQLAGL